MDIKQEIAKLKAILAELETKASEPLDCYFDKEYYVKHDGSISSCNQADNTDYTCIRNIETTKTVAPLIQIQRALINFKCEHDPVFNLRRYTTAFGMLKLDERYSLAVELAMQSIAFSTQELAQAALDMLKRRNLV